MTIAEERQIFLAALDLPSKVARDGYLDQVCRDNPSLRHSIDQLLLAHERSSGILNAPLGPSSEQRQYFDDLLTIVRSASDDANEPRSDRIGDLVGNYRLLERIGEGGFGEVYVAQQEQPVRRRVAVKLLKLGMSSQEVLGRFEAERQALAMMDHPNIAQVFDAGTTTEGQPFFAMELVRGVPINQFCEGHQLGIRQRIELFIDVCQAVHHAHQKGVIHRDLKPSNVLVTLHDVKAVVKVIDFGVAKAIGEPLTRKAIYTRFMQLIGTPMYMSPEQAEMNALDVDTRCDVFSLGMLLYEILTGTTPYEEERLSSAPFDELRRIIREEELPRPSYRLRTLGTQQSTVSARRQISPKQLLIELRGELDWIVMKATDKDRSRRYETVSALVGDLRKYLANEPIDARPPSAWYRFSKLARRHKLTIIAASLVAIAMLTGTAVSLWQASQARAERDAKEVARKEADQARREVEEFATRMRQASVEVASGRAHADAGRWSEAAVAYTRATEMLPEDFHVWAVRGAFSIRLGLWKSAAKDFEEALKLEPLTTEPEWWGVPQLLLFADNEEVYRTTARRMWNEASGDLGGSFAWAFRSCLFTNHTPVAPVELLKAAKQLREQSDDHAPRERPDSDDPAPLDRTRNRDESPDRGGPSRKHNHRQSPPMGFPGHDRGRRTGGFPEGVALYLTGLAHYRAGRYDEAVEFFRTSTSERVHWQHKAIVNPALAMALYRLGEVENATQALADTDQVISGWTTTMLNGGVGTNPPVPWFDYIECLILHREATILLTGHPPNIDGRWFTLEERARAAIR